MDLASLVSAGSKRAFKAPRDLRTNIWHYMDFTNLVAMFEERGLFLSRADSLDDKFEGSMSRPTKDYVLNGQRLTPEEYGKLLRRVRACSYVHCWHMSDHESAAMWQLYSSASQSVCLQSTYERLRRTLPEDVHIATINYISYEQDKIPFDNLYWPLLHKRKSFEHERELRALYGDVRSLERNESSKDASWLRRVDLEDLIERIYVSPWSNDWFTDLVRKVVRRYKLDIPVHRSVLDQEPIL